MTIKKNFLIIQTDSDFFFYRSSWFAYIGTFLPKTVSEGLNLLLVRTHWRVVKIDAWAWNVNCNKRMVREATSAVSRGPTYWPTHVQKDRHHSFVAPCVSRVYLRFIVIRVHSPFALFRAPVSGRLACQWMDHKCMRMRADRTRETIHFRLEWCDRIRPIDCRLFYYQKLWIRYEFGKMRAGTVLNLRYNSLKLKWTSRIHELCFRFCFFF